MISIVRASIALLALWAPGMACYADEAVTEPDRRNSLTVFAGSLMTGTFPGWTLIPYAGGVEGNHLVSAAYQRHLFDLPWGFTTAAEAGLAARFGDGTSGELWGGAVLGHQGLTIGPVTVSPALVVGLSAVTGPIGIERQREITDNGDATLLFYLGPELAFRHKRHPNVSFVYRVHHRSGAEGTLGNMREGHNANLFGVRLDF